MKWIKEALGGRPLGFFGKNMNFIGQPNFYDYTYSFVFLGMFLGNDFVPRLEIFDVFMRGIDDMYERYHSLNASIILGGKIQVHVFIKLLEELAKEEPVLLAKRNQYPFELLEKHLDKGVLDFVPFREAYYNEWVGISTEEEIEKMCHNYLSTIIWCWIYYTKTCPDPNHFYQYHYPPFCCDLAKYIKTWKFPKFEWPGGKRYVDVKNIECVNVIGVSEPVVKIPSLNNKNCSSTSKI